MLFDTIAQGIRCTGIIKELNAAVGQVKVWEDHVSRLNENISSENRQLDNLRRQAERTGDHEGFAPDIRRIEDKIKNLERQLIDAEDNVRHFREQALKLEREMNREGCHGVA